MVVSDRLSPDVKALILSLLSQDPNKRPSIIEALTSPWVRRLQNEFRIADRSPEDFVYFQRATLSPPKVLAPLCPKKCLASPIKSRSSPQAIQIRDLIEYAALGHSSAKQMSKTTRNMKKPDDNESCNITTSIDEGVSDVGDEGASGKTLSSNCRV